MMNPFSDIQVVLDSFCMCLCVCFRSFLSFFLPPPFLFLSLPCFGRPYIASFLSSSLLFVAVKDSFFPADDEMRERSFRFSLYFKWSAVLSPFLFVFFFLDNFLA